MTLFRYLADRLVLWVLGGAIALGLLVIIAWRLAPDTCGGCGDTVRSRVTRIYDGARSYYLLLTESQPPQPPHFPRPDADFTPPVGSCCKQGGKCRPDAALWEREPWLSLAFSIDKDDRYSYGYQVADDGRSFTVTAIGDLDCDGDYSTFEMQGEVGADGQIPGRVPVFRDNELE